MRTIDNLQEVLEKHQKWLNDEEGGVRANLIDANLSNANLSNANLIGADLSNAVLSNADLRYANLIGADLSGANLRYADLRYANLSNSNLSNADLSDSNLSNAILGEKENCRKGIILKEQREAYKRCGKYIVKLLIPSGAIVFSINNDRCRTNKAYVMAILNDDETIANVFSVASEYKRTFVYKVGRSIEIEDFDLMYNVECSTGIHFFWDFERAKSYN